MFPTHSCSQSLTCKMEERHGNSWFSLVPKTLGAQSIVHHQSYSPKKKKPQLMTTKEANTWSCHQTFHVTSTINKMAAVLTLVLSDDMFVCYWLCQYQCIGAEQPVTSGIRCTQFWFVIGRRQGMRCHKDDSLQVSSETTVAVCCTKVGASLRYVIYNCTYVLYVSTVQIRPIVSKTKRMLDARPGRGA